MKKSFTNLAKKLGYEDALGLLYHFPRRYEDRSRWEDPFLLDEGEQVTTFGKVVDQSIKFTRSSKKIIEIILQIEGSYKALKLVWFVQRYMKWSDWKGKWVIAYGRMTWKSKGNKREAQMMHPEYEVVEPEEYEEAGKLKMSPHLNRITPVYPLREKVKQKALRATIWEIIEKEQLVFPELYEHSQPRMSRGEAMLAIHFPESLEEVEQARRRLALDELVCMELALVRRRMLAAKAVKVRGSQQYDLVNTLRGVLPFQLTEAQLQACREIDQDLSKEIPMNRLLQGDVGSGKTVVALHALLRSLESGKNGALLAPTEILANQHFKNIKRLVEPIGVHVELHTRNNRFSGETLFSSQPTIYVGTHALIQGKVVIPNFGLGVIDEQHKFGVLQRTALLGKGEAPDLLVMTATPIPRTLCLTVYGDLDVSVIQHLPPGRKVVKTVLRDRSSLHNVWDYIKKENARGRQAYVVYPLVEDSEKIDLKSVKAGYEELKEIFGENQVGIVHGKMDAGDKDESMQKFRSGECGVLVATSVIEVGVDVPNATIMVIEHAGRFGLAQLHQLRGRVGRGADQSYCILVDEMESIDSWKRLKIMEQTANGFELAEEDFKIRGPGNILGTEQSGLPPLKVARLPKDLPMISKAKKLAEKILDSDPELSEHEGLKKVLGHYWTMAEEVANN